MWATADETLGFISNPSVTNCSAANENYYWGHQRVLLFPWPAFKERTRIILNAENISVLRGLKTKSSKREKRRAGEGRWC